jgi:hypothetical protein
MSTPTTFFANFSLRELVPNAEAGPSSAGHWGMGGAVGGATGYRASGQSHCHKSESFSLPVSVSGHDRFDEREFVESLKAGIENRIIDNAAVITDRGDIEGNFHSSEFYFEYTQGELRGRIVLSGTLTGTTYSLRANLEERSEGGFSFADAFQMMKPEGDYYVVAFAHGDPPAQDNKLLLIGRELITASVDRIRRSMQQEGLKEPISAEVWCLAKLPQQIERLLAEKDLKDRFEVPEEYQEYEKVFFLNDVALQMYSEGGITLEILKKISGAEMPKGCTRTLRGPYLPKINLPG